MKQIRIEEVGDIHFKYRYLEVFAEGSNNPFLDIGITDDRALSFKFYASQQDILLSVEQLENILTVAKAFLPKALNDADFDARFLKQQEPGEN